MLIFAGVGPGDPELITRKTARALTECDAVAVPDSGRGESVVEAICGELIEGKPVIRLNMPMKGMRADWKEAHEAAAKQLRDALDTYGTVVYPVLGDPMVYATSSYLMGLLEPEYECSVIPGIPAMCAAASMLKVPLVEQGETLTVLDRFEETDPLPETNAVIMKSGKRIGWLKEKCAGREAYVARNAGMPNEWLGALKDMPEDGYSYFTTVILK